MDVVFYHSDCPDGFAAAIIAQKKWPRIELIPAVHGAIPEFKGVTDLDVLVVDFSWPRWQCEKLRLVAKSLQIIDHHVTAQRELENFPGVIFDMKRSGAGLTWDTLFTGLPRPWWVDYVEDRDLWQLKLPGTKAVNAFIMALPHTADAWSVLDGMTASEAAQAGHGILLHIIQYVENVVRQRKFGRINGKTVAVVNAPYMNSSDIGAVLCDYAEVGVIWFERGDGQMQFGLRSRTANVADIAKLYGGGGHPQAAGFQLSLDNGREVLDTMLLRIGS